MNYQQVPCGCYLVCNVMLTENNSPFPVIVRSRQAIIGGSSSDSKRSVHERWPYRRIIHNKHRVPGCQIFKEWEEGLRIRKESKRNQALISCPP